jgi:amino acid transporter
VYAFASRGLGVRVGFLSGWALLFTYFTFSVASAGEVGLFFQTFVGLLGGSVPWILPSLAALALILGLGLRRLELGTRVTLIVEGISVTLILITVIVILAHLGTHAVSVTPFKLPHGIALSSVGLASIFGFLSFAGFEGAAVLGEGRAIRRVPFPERSGLPFSVVGSSTSWSSTHNPWALAWERQE